MGTCGAAGGLGCSSLAALFALQRSQLARGHPSARPRSHGPSPCLVPPAHNPPCPQSLQPHLATIAASPTQETASTKSSGLAGGRGTLGQGAALTAVDDRLYAFEAAGLLVGQEDVPAPQQRAWVAALLQPLVGQMEANLAAAAAAAAAGGGGAVPAAGTPRFGAPQGPPPPALLVQQALEAVTRVARGLSLRLCTEARPELGGLLVGALQAAVAAPRALPGSKPLRRSYISFLHRMVECLGAT